MNRPSEADAEAAAVSTGRWQQNRPSPLHRFELPFRVRSQRRRRLVAVGMGACLALSGGTLLLLEGVSDRLDDEEVQNGGDDGDGVIGGVRQLRQLDVSGGIRTQMRSPGGDDYREKRQAEDAKRLGGSSRSSSSSSDVSALQFGSITSTISALFTSRSDGTDTAFACPLDASRFNVCLDLNGFSHDVSSATANYFLAAKSKWESVVIGHLPPASALGLDPKFMCNAYPSTIDDVYICGKGRDLDGPGGMLGLATVAYYRTKSKLPLVGYMEFDNADVRQLGDAFEEVVLHEMGHILGIGKMFWDMNGAVAPNGTYIGEAGVREWSKHQCAGEGAGGGGPPVEMDGPEGTRHSHWDEVAMRDELMTGYLNGCDPCPLSTITVAALEDIGYDVDYDAADEYVPPCARRWGQQGWGQQGWGQGHGAGGGGWRPPPFPDAKEQHDHAKREADAYAAAQQQQPQQQEQQQAAPKQQQQQQQEAAAQQEQQQQQRKPPQQRPFAQRTQGRGGKRRGGRGAGRAGRPLGRRAAGDADVAATSEEGTGGGELESPAATRGQGRGGRGGGRPRLLHSAPSHPLSDPSRSLSSSGTSAARRIGLDHIRRAREERIFDESRAKSKFGRGMGLVEYAADMFVDVIYEEDGNVYVVDVMAGDDEDEEEEKEEDKNEEN